MPQWDKIKTERKSMYLDIILGIGISTLSIFCIIFATITGFIDSFSISYVVGLGFWIFWLGVSIFLLFLGIKSYYNEKHFNLTGEHKKPRKLKAPMVS